MRRARLQRTDPLGKARFGIAGGSLSGKLVADLRRVGFRYGDRTILRQFSATILRGDRVGIIGPNGCGKTTLLKLVLGEVEPTEGEVVRGTRLEIAYFDQQRARLDIEKTVRENMGDSDYITVRGRSRHLVGYLKDFLFPPQRVDSPVKALSGGERNRLLLAKIFTRSVNMMVLDEPTNDLDVDTLELLEELLTDYQGTLLLVSHDRTFLDNVVTSTLVFEGEGRVEEYVGGYADWERYRELVRGEESVPPKRPEPAAGSPPRPERKPAPAGRKLSYKEQRELEALPDKIEILESEQANLHRALSDPDFHRGPRAAVTAAIDRLQAVTKDLEMCYARWEDLESR
jgi:ATP-binding cassette subfamily F protein uup